MAWKSGQSYSTDLRSRVLAAVDGGSPAGAVAQQFQVSVSYIYKALARRGATGEIEARPQRNRQALKLAAHHEAIAAEVARRPDVTLEELRAWLRANHQVTASLGLMHKTLARLGLTLKKSRCARPSRIGPTSPSAGQPGGRAGRAEPVALDLHRRDRGDDQHGPPLRPRPRGQRLRRPVPHGHVWTPPPRQAVSSGSPARDRVQPCVRPLMRPAPGRGPVWEFEGQVHITGTRSKRSPCAWFSRPASPTLRHTCPSPSSRPRPPRGRPPQADTAGAR